MGSVGLVLGCIEADFSDDTVMEISRPDLHNALPSSPLRLLNFGEALLKSVEIGKFHLNLLKR